MTAPLSPACATYSTCTRMHPSRPSLHFNPSPACCELHDVGASPGASCRKAGSRQPLLVVCEQAMMFVLFRLLRLGSAGATKGADQKAGKATRLPEAQRRERGAAAELAFGDLAAVRGINDLLVQSGEDARDGLEHRVAPALGLHRAEDGRLPAKSGTLFVPGRTGCSAAHTALSCVAWIPQTS